MEKTAYIVGAGLSHYAGLPLQSEFTRQILAARGYRRGPSRKMVKLLDDFVHDVFNLRKPADQQKCPDLKNIFTFIDLPQIPATILGRSTIQKSFVEFVVF